MHRIWLLVYASLAPRNRYRTSCVKAPSDVPARLDGGLARRTHQWSWLCVRRRRAQRGQPRHRPDAVHGRDGTRFGSTPSADLHRPRRDSSSPASVCGVPRRRAGRRWTYASVESRASDRGAGRSSLASPRRRTNRATPWLGGYKLRDRIRPILSASEPASGRRRPCDIALRRSNRPETTLRFRRPGHRESNGGPEPGISCPVDPAQAASANTQANRRCARQSVIASGTWVHRGRTSRPSARRTGRTAGRARSATADRLPARRARASRRPARRRAATTRRRRSRGSGRRIRGRGGSGADCRWRWCRSSRSAPRQRRRRHVCWLGGRAGRWRRRQG